MPPAYCCWRRCDNEKRLQAARLDAIVDVPTKGMGAEDFPFFTVDPSIKGVYSAIVGTLAEVFERAKEGGPPVPSHHSPLFRISPEPAKLGA